MKKLVSLLMISVGLPLAYADSATVTNANAQYINRLGYIQNPYNSENYPTTGGGTLVVSESQTAHQNAAQKLFEDGTYNIYTGMTLNANNVPYGAPAGNAYAYGGSLFAQTGQLAGFSVGGAFSVFNPVLSTELNGSGAKIGGVDYNVFNPSYAQALITQAFIEYQYKNIVQADVGYIGINNSPWLNGNYENNLLTVPTTYQGVLINVYPGAGWLLTALAFNGAQYGAQPGFTGATQYQFTSAGLNASSNGTIAVGANYSGWNNNYNLRLWGYQFDNYGTLLYSDTSLTMPVNNKLSFNLAAQVATDQQWLQANNAITTKFNQNIQSYMAGIKANMTYDWFQLNLSANTMWGPSNAYNGGVIVSPYTVGQSVDPTYSNGWMINMITNGFTGSEYKIGTQFGFLNNNLTIIPQYVVVSSGNVQWNGTQDADLIINYSIPQVKGLFLFGVYGNEWLPAQNPIGQLAWTSEIGVFYAY